MSWAILNLQERGQGRGLQLLGQSREHTADKDKLDLSPPSFPGPLVPIMQAYSQRIKQVVPRVFVLHEVLKILEHLKQKRA